MKSMGRFVSEVILIAISLAPAVLGLIAWSRLPGRMAIHYNPMGMPDRFADRSVAVFLLPILAIGISLGLLALSKHSAIRRSRSDSGHGAGRYIWRLRLLMTLFISYVGWLLIEANLNSGIDFLWCAMLGATVVLIFLSSEMIGVEGNRLFGIRNPWTLKSESNWQRTNALWGRISVISFVMLAILSSWLSGPQLLVGMLAALLFVVVGSTIYSYKISRITS